ncbi:MAG: dihydroorotase [Methanobacteriota archaeon]
MELAIEGNAFVGGSFVRCRIGIEDGRVKRIAKVLRADKVVGFPRGVILPGGIDLHVHFRDPGDSRQEDFASGTLAALHGGTTTVFDMPNTRPFVSTRRAFDAKLRRARRRAHVDFGLFAGVDETLRAFGLGRRAAGYKLYMSPSTGAAGLADPGVIRTASEYSARLGRIFAVHAEDAGHFRDVADGPATHAAARPSVSETAAVRTLRAHARRAHVCHVSTPRTLRVLAGSRLTTEASPHHLFLDVGAFRKQGAFVKTNPPLRSAAEREALWRALRSGRIDCVASDHAPHTLAEKRGPDPPSGVPGVETRVPMVLAAAAARRLPWRVAVEALATAPGRIAGIPKGEIRAGFDADLIHVDLGDARRIRAADLHSRCGWTPFAGMPGVFPDAVFRGGQLALWRGEPLVRRGTGRHVADASRRRRKTT